jgi:hypothetical protein
VEFSAAPLLAEAIRRAHNGESLSRDGLAKALEHRYRIEK